MFKEGRGHWAFYYTSSQSFIINFSYSMVQQLWKLLLNFDWMVHQVEFTNVLTTYCNLKKSLYFKCLYVECTYVNVHQFISHCLIPLDPWKCLAPFYSFAYSSHYHIVIR